MSKEQQILDKLKEVHVNFNDNDEQIEKKKYFTAKYGLHQMNLIRKRLNVENWMIEKLNELCNGSDEELDEIDLDLDEILDIENETKQREFLKKKINKTDKQQDVENFINNLLEKLRTL